MTFQEPNKKWFKDLKKSRKDFKNVTNIIEATKFKYEKESHTIEWVIGIGLALFFSVSISGENTWINKITLLGSIISLALIFITVILQIISSRRHKQAMSWLYREKDKQENNSKKK